MLNRLIPNCRAFCACVRSAGPFHLGRLLTVALQDADDAINQIRGDFAVGAQHGLKDPFRVRRHNWVPTAATGWSSGKAGRRIRSMGQADPVEPVTVRRQALTARAANHLGALGAGSPSGSSLPAAINI